MLFRSNRSGADAVMTSSTGFPMAVDFARGYPCYRPYDGNAGGRLARGEVDLVVVLGSPSLVPAELLALMAPLPCVAIGPRASQGALAGSAIVVDTGVAGIHEGSLALRMDDVPLPLRPPLDGPPQAAVVVRAIRERLRARAG